MDDTTARAELLAVQSAAARMDRAEKNLSKALGALRLAEAEGLIAVTLLQEAIRASKHGEPAS